MELEKIPKNKFKAQALEIMRRIENTGKPVVITSNGQPSLKIIRFEPKTPMDVVKELQGSVEILGDIVKPVGEDDWEVLK
ncbi:type II toxin-antitoxin system prevent-host-death family antitoxin [Endozoicomonas sp. 4G]|uniref:type II toxin-antitoxin system Phd/YefM family antitoxin n=1 Tax=Endozoicomonas sp. 4G TaxID=2872754 RepID=UPI0020790579|nr:type II toxin-antitoxin system prevent-host-death family antitoxin [Endozoicomonas sp. 4G]